MSPRTETNGTKKRRPTGRSQNGSSRARRRAAAKSKPTAGAKKLSRLRKPDDMSLETWQVALRREFGRQQNFRLVNVGSEPIFSDFQVTNPQTGRTAVLVSPYPEVKLVDWGEVGGHLAWFNGLDVAPLSDQEPGIVERVCYVVLCDTFDQAESYKWLKHYL